LKFKTGILFFARTPEAEASVKAWTPYRKKNVSLAQKLYLHSSQLLKKSGYPIFEVNNDQQIGQNFNEKISNALADFFKQGFEQAIVIGSDCPNLSLSDIDRAYENCTQGIPTIGSSYDGGVYLFTLGKNQFDYQRMSLLPWCSSELGAALREEINGATEFPIFELAVKHDVDFNLFSSGLLLKTLNKFFRRFLNSLVSPRSLNETYFFSSKSTSKNSISLRGPPVLHLA